VTTDIGHAYADPAYADALSEFGTPIRLEGSGGWLLERKIGGTAHGDLMGAYPVFSCVDWSRLASDLDDLPGSPVSVVVVADPLARLDAHQLASCFRDHVVLYKRHFVRDLTAPARLSSHHRRNVRRASRSVEVEALAEPQLHLDEWADLYAGLATRHRLSGIRAFSRESFRRQLGLPGLLALRATRVRETVAMTLWLVDGENAYYHLGASSDAGRAHSSSYALFAAALEILEDRGVRHVDFGGVPGDATVQNGLFRFRSGWANAEHPAYLCGRILDRVTYEALTTDRMSSSGWFPAYRGTDVDFAQLSRKGAAGAVGSA
jgi:hypothetical protein